MRLYLKDEFGTEITGLHFETVRKVINTGGSLRCYMRDTTLASVESNFSSILERVEVRKDDGSTVIWEGAIDRCTQNSQPLWRFIMEGKEILYFMDKISCNYNAILVAGVVTAITDPTITDANTDVSGHNTKFCLFTNKSSEESIETIWPNANCDWYNDGAGDDPADVETKTPTGDENDLADPGTSAYWEIYDNDNRGKDYYGIDIDFTVPNQATSTKVEISIHCMFEPQVTYASVANSPIIYIYDVTGTSWEDDDTLNAGNITGIGRTSFYSTGWDKYGTGYKGVITITDNLDRYFDGSNFLKIRILGGQSTVDDVHERVRVYSAKLINIYSANFDIAGSTVYTIDASTTTTLTFTGQTPDSDGVDVGDTFTVGDTLANNIAAIWRYAQITWVDLDFDSTTLVEAVDYRNQFIATVLQDYAERLNREVWQQIGWTIQCKSSYTDTTLNLTEANFLSWSHSLTGKDLHGTLTLYASSRYKDYTWATSTYYTPTGKFYVDTRFAEMAMAGVAETNFQSKFSDGKQIFTGEIDLDDGTNYSALDVGKTVDIAIQTNRIVITAGLIMELSYKQNAGEHLICTMVVQY